MTQTCSAGRTCQWRVVEDLAVAEAYGICSLQNLTFFVNGKGFPFTDTNPQLPTKGKQLYKL
jgi:hypothetical protein